MTETETETVTENRAEMRWRAELIREHTDDSAPRMVIAVADLLALLDSDEVYEELRAEEERHIQKGYTPEHDDHHGVPHLLEWADRYGRDGTRRGLVKAAGLTIAAIRTFDRAVAADGQEAGR